MTKLSNAEYWHEIEDLVEKILVETSEDNANIWKWLEKLQEAKLTKLQLLRLRGLLQSIVNGLVPEFKR